MLYFILLLGLALAQTTSNTTTTSNSTNSTGPSNATMGSSNTTVVNSTNTTGTSNSSQAGSNQASSGQTSSEQSSSESSTSSESGQGQTNTTTTTTTTTQQGKGQGQQQGKGQGQSQQGQGQSQQGQGQSQQSQGKAGKSGQFILCRTCGAACSTPQIRNGVCNMKLKCLARRNTPPNCAPQLMGGQGQFSAGGPGQFSSGQGQFSSMNQGQLSSTTMGGQLNSIGQNSMLSMSGQLAATRCAPLNCPMIPTCSWPSMLQTPMLNGCPGCPMCIIPGGCTADSQCSTGTYCVLGRCMTYAQEGDTCGTLFTACQPPLVCTVMGTCYLPDCSCGYLPCPPDQQVTLQPDFSLVTGGCPPCPTCKS